MKSLKIFWALAIFAFVVLGAAAVWLGGLNQDEGWYLYAANMVHDGERVYRDFFFTQGPFMPKAYSYVTWIWEKWGLLGARIFTLLLGAYGICIAAMIARKLAPEGRRNEAALIVTLLLGCNLYHLYYLAIPKTYALASVLVMTGFWFFELEQVNKTAIDAFMAGVLLAFAAGVRISLGVLLPVVGLALLVRRGCWIRFGIGGILGLLAMYGFVLRDPAAMKGFIAAQQYHAARGGFDLVWAVGSLSRLVRWYLPVFIVLGLGVAGTLKVGGWRLKVGQWNLHVLLLSFFAVFAVQMLAPFPYEDYQVPVMGLLAVYAAVSLVKNTPAPSFNLQPSTFNLLLVLGLCFANSFGSPLLEKWMTNGQDRFWTLKKGSCEMAQLRDVARRIEAQDPGGKTLLTQDLYLAIETGRSVPKGLEMGPFAMLSDAEWRDLLGHPSCPIAALSGYSFAVEPPVCKERSIDLQMEYWSILKRKYELVSREENFGQNQTTLLLLKRK